MVCVSQVKPGMDSIVPMELLPIVIVAAIYRWLLQSQSGGGPKVGPKWAGCTVCSNCDNDTVVSVNNSGRCEHELMMHLMRCLLFFAAKNNSSKAHPQNYKYTSGCILLQQTRTVLPRSPGQSLLHTHPTQPTSGPGPQKARLDFNGLYSLVRYYFQCSLAPSTR